jgi:plasmid maintenance system antidote protein VapI
MTREKMIEYLKANYLTQKTEQMARALGVSRATIFRLYSRAGITNPRTYTRPPASVCKKRAAFIKSKKGKWTATQLAKALGCTKDQVYNLCRSYDLDIKPGRARYGKKDNQGKSGLFNPDLVKNEDTFLI